MASFYLEPSDISVSRWADRVCSHLDEAVDVGTISLHTICRASRPLSEVPPRSGRHTSVSRRLAPCQCASSFPGNRLSCIPVIPPRCREKGLDLARGLVEPRAWGRSSVEERAAAVPLRSFAPFAGCGTILSTSSQFCMDGDTACAQVSCGISGEKMRSLKYGHQGYGYQAGYYSGIATCRMLMKL